MNKTELAENLIARVKHACPVRKGTEAWRIIVDFKDDSKVPEKLVKDYYIWVTGEYLEDEAKLNSSIDSAQKFALEVVKRRYRESGNQIPVENGVSLSNEAGEVLVDPRDFVHPLEKNNE